MVFDKESQDLFFKLVEGDKELAATLCELFSKDWPMVYSDLQKACRRGQHSDAEKCAHRLKGNLRNFFVSGLAEQFAEIEKSAREEKLDTIEFRLPELKKALTQLDQELADYLRSLN
jgi:HPt (histidine-containing phosphotransfer) domain-containing protein